MRIAYVSTIKGSSWGGSEELWFQSAKEAIKQNCEVGIFIYDWPAEPAPIGFLREQGAFIHKRKRVHSHLSKFIVKGIPLVMGKKPAFLNPYRQLLDFKPDIIIVTDGGTYYTANDPELSGELLRSFKNRYIIVSQLNTHYHLPSNRQHAIELFDNACRVYFVSEHNRRLAGHQLAHRLNKAAYIQNPVLLSSFDSKPFPDWKDGIHCAVIGRLSISDKGQDILIAMMSDPYWNDIEIKLHFYGKGEDKEYLEQLIAYYSVGNKVFIEGFSEDKDAIWDKCHCLILGSHKEGTSLAMLEAMVAGRVCIVSKVGGSGEWIQDGYNGFLVDAPTEELFLNKLKNAVAEIARWQTIGMNAHASAMKRMDMHPGKTLFEDIRRCIGG